MTALSDAGPVLCVIEDLHWGDGASVAYLDDALRANAARPLMLLALARPEVHDLFPSLWSRANVQEIKLQGLTKKASEKLIKSVLEQVSDETVARLTERSDGNAFHLEELIRHVAERSADSMPDTVLALAEARIARLDADARRFLRVASVFGETFWEPGVVALLGAPSDALARLVDAEVVSVGAGRKFTREHQFRHGLLRDAAYAMLTDKIAPRCTSPRARGSSRRASRTRSCSRSTSSAVANANAPRSSSFTRRSGRSSRSSSSPRARSPIAAFDRARRARRSAS